MVKAFKSTLEDLEDRKSVASTYSFQSLHGSRSLFGRPVSSELFFIDDNKSPMESPYDLGPSEYPLHSSMQLPPPSSTRNSFGAYFDRAKNRAPAHSGTKLGNIPEKIPLVQRPVDTHRFSKSTSLDATVKLAHV